MHAKYKRGNCNKIRHKPQADKPFGRELYRGIAPLGLLPGHLEDDEEGTKQERLGQELQYHNPIERQQICRAFSHRISEPPASVWHVEAALTSRAQNEMEQQSDPQEESEEAPIDQH